MLALAIWVCLSACYTGLGLDRVCVFPRLVRVSFRPSGKCPCTRIEDTCFLAVNTKYISSSELKTSEFSRVRSTSENVYVFNSRDEIYLVFTERKQIFFLFYTIHGHFPIHKAGGENAKTKNYHIVPYVLTKKMNTHTLCFRS